MRSIIKGILVTFATILIGYVITVYAQTAVTAGTPDQALQTPCGTFIQDLGDKAISIMKDKNLTEDQRSGKYRDLLHDAFDLQTIGRFVIGRAWMAATLSQQQEYMKLFEELVLKTYGDRLNFYSGEDFKVSAVRQESDKDFVVLSQVTHTDGSTGTSIDWRVRDDGGKLAVVDVVISGVSQSITQRDEYASVIQHDGGKIDSLLTLMRQRLQINRNDKQQQ